MLKRRVDYLQALEWIVPPFYVAPMAEHRRLVLPWPPSINHYKEPAKRGKATRLRLSPKARDYRYLALQYIGKQWTCGYNARHLPTLECPVAVVATYIPLREISDIDNFAKGPLDALRHANIYRDDSQIKRKISVLAPPSKPGCVELLIVPLLTGDSA